MYKHFAFSSILIVKLSSFGDIIQNLHVLDYLHDRFPEAAIDWAVSEEWTQAVSMHPLVRRVIPIDMECKRRSWKALRAARYDLLFDLQGNCKSGLITWLARAKEKVGFGWRSVREWPNVLATHRHVEISRQQNIRLFHLQLLQRFFEDPKPYEIGSLPLKTVDTARDLSLPPQPRVMVCPGSKWPNKQLSSAVLGDLLSRIAKLLDPSFLLMWGSEKEHAYCLEIQNHFSLRAVLIDKLPIPIWQSLMREVDFMIAVDSSALHLCGATSTPTFSIFGPTNSDIFKPLGEKHGTIQGACPYGRVFEKQCPVLRTCPTGACIKNLTGEEIFLAFQQWMKIAGSDSFWAGKTTETRRS